MRPPAVKAGHRDVFPVGENHVLENIYSFNGL